MFRGLKPERFCHALGVVIVGLVLMAEGRATAQDGPAPSDSTASPRERELRDQLKNILRELEDLQQQKEHTEPEIQRPAIVKEPREPSSEEALPHYELADTSIVSKRLQRRPEGITFSATVPAETDSQPTRTMRESLESLPGVIVRQANGPRDFSMSIRGSGVKTTFAVRDSRCTRMGSSKLNRTASHDSTFTIPGSCGAWRSLEVPRPPCMTTMPWAE